MTIENHDGVRLGWIPKSFWLLKQIMLRERAWKSDSSRRKRKDGEPSIVKWRSILPVKHASRCTLWFYIARKLLCKREEPYRRCTNDTGSGHCNAMKTSIASKHCWKPSKEASRNVSDGFFCDARRMEGCSLRKNRERIVILGFNEIFFFGIVRLQLYS